MGAGNADFWHFPHSPQYSAHRIILKSWTQNFPIGTEEGGWNGV